MRELEGKGFLCFFRNEEKESIAGISAGRDMLNMSLDFTFPSPLSSGRRGRPGPIRTRLRSKGTGSVLSPANLFLLTDRVRSNY
jgi:hypothetical protein